MFYTYAEVVKLQMVEQNLPPHILTPFMVKGRRVEHMSPQKAVLLLPKRYRSDPVHICR